MVYSHRGGPLEVDESGELFIENTIEAFRNSKRLQVDLLELDVQLTKDKVVIVAHDVDMGRLFGRPFKGRRISEFAYADLPCLQPHLARAGPNGREPTSTSTKIPRVPLLEDIFVEFPDLPIQIDLKANTPGLVPAVGGLIEKYGRGDLVLWGSFSHSINLACYQYNPQIPLFMSLPRLIYLLYAYRTGNMAQVQIYESAAILPWKISFPSWYGQSLQWSALNEGWFRSLADRSVKVIVYGGINSNEAFKSCLHAGVDAICTDNPSLLIDYLRDTSVRP